MFENEELKTHLQTSYAIESDSAVVAEWNMNIPNNIQKLGNYRYREDGSRFSVIPNFFDPNDQGGFYTGATDADVTIESGFEEDGSTPQLFTYPKDKEKALYSLEDCIKPFRPRSGINKLSYFSNKFLPFSNKDMYLRPRYYMPTKEDEFKYWRSYRTESDSNEIYTSTISDTAIINSIVDNINGWTAVISGLESVASLSIGKVIAGGPSETNIFGATGTVGSITGSGPWTATLSGLTSTEGLLIGDQITAEADTGELFSGSPTSVVITSILNATSITYTVTGGSAPENGQVLLPSTVPGSLGSGEVKVTAITGPSTIEVFISGSEEPTYGSLSDIYINKYKINAEYGISKNNDNGRYVIEDTNPFVAYKEPVPTNRIVVKVQTNVGDINLGPFRNSGSLPTQDPFFGEANKTVPKNFRVQYLSSSDQWLDAYVFNEASLRDDQESPIFGSDGYLSLEYGISIPQEYRNNFTLVDTVKNANVLPAANFVGKAYLVVPEEGQKGTLYIFNGVDYDELVPEYKWFIGTDGVYENTHFVTDFTNPAFYNEAGEGESTYREFVWVKGLRLLVETMNVPNTPLELIELSPRLVANVSNSLLNFSVTKALADLSSSALPVGQLLAGTGDLSLFDGDQAFNENNPWDFSTQTGSIIAKHINKNIKFVFYEVIKNVNASNYYVPLKTMYSEGFPERDPRTGETVLSLRDFYFYFESLKAPRILLTEVSLSQAVAILLDSIGFSNYVFKRKDSEIDPVIPHFFIPPDESVASILESLARATQSAMFFDEYNNFVVITKEYLLDESIERLPDTTLYGSNSEDGKLANIVAIASKERKVYNAGSVNYASNYIGRTGGTIAQTVLTDKNYVYLPSLLWEVAGTETTGTKNDTKQERFTLSALPLNSDLTDQVPFVSTANELQNNTFDVGENAYWMSRFKGFLYANGEIIKYDAVEYNVTGTGNVWISSNLEFQEYFTNLPFNGKIYPTGLIRIYTEPFFETFTGITITRNNQEIGSSVRLKPGAVISHGRGQFGTPIVNHKAGLDPYWSDNANIKGCEMDSSLLFGTEIDKQIPATTIGPAGISNSIAQKTQRNGIIRNILSTRFNTENDISSLKTVNAGTIQSSALVMTGPDFEPGATPRNFVSYVSRKLDAAYKHFGTRVRIIGQVIPAEDAEENQPRSQTVVGGMTYFNIPGVDPTTSISVGGGSAGINIVNPDTNNGYYFELAAVSALNLEDYLQLNEAGESTVSLENILFYKVKQNAAGGSKAVPVKLWGGIGSIVVDDGNFAGQSRYFGEELPTVYDLAVEYVDVNDTRRDFYLYINQKLVARVTDNEPIPLINSSVGLFVRGTAKAMFENIYALGKNYATNAVFDTDTPIASVFGDKDNQINAIEALNKYALSGVVQNTYLSNISPSGDRAYNLYYEEFGSILREMAYFNIKYDRAFPALYAKIAPTFNRLKGYTVSGFTADSYGAEFLVFNNTDTVLSLDQNKGNYLRILGIAFTRETTNTLTVDDYLKKRGSTSDPEFTTATEIQSPFKFIEQYEKVRQSRLVYGKNDFTLESVYIQDADTAENILGWVIDKNIRPRKSIGLNVFSMPTLQLGDLVTISYKDNDGINLVSDEDTKYVVYNISYSRSSSGPDMTVYLSEV